MRVFAVDGVLSSSSGMLMIALALMLLMWLAFLVTATLIVRRVYRRVRRWRGWHQGAAAVQPRTLMPGPGRDVARLRRDLREEVQAAEVMLSRAKDGRVFIADARALLDDLKISAAALDADLASIQGYKDVAQQRSARDALRPQVAKLIQTSYLARQTMLNTEIADRERHLTDLNEHVERQAAALKIYRQGTHGLDLGDAYDERADPSDSQSPSPATTSHPAGTSSPSWGSARLG
jgi:hypothetical protein